jgi:proline iminopeptidase
MEIAIDSVNIYVLSVGAESNYPLFILHGGPGLDHTEMFPWYNSLGDRFRLLYVDERGQGRSQRVDPATLTLSRFAQDITDLAAALNLSEYAILGHSFGSFITLAHAIEQGGASHYVLSGCTASFTKTMAEVQHNLAIFEPVELREQVTQSWALEPLAKTQEDVEKIMDMQMPFHFATVTSDAYKRFMAAQAEAHPIYAPEVLAYFAEHEYAIEYEDQLHKITKPTLVITGERDNTCTPRASRDVHAGIAHSELVIVPDAGHMTYVEQPDIYFPAVRALFAHNGIA